MVLRRKYYGQIPEGIPATVARAMTEIGSKRVELLADATTATQGSPLNKVVYDWSIRESRLQATEKLWLISKETIETVLWVFLLIGQFSINRSI